jgi:preprotein translocase subunit SecE
VKGTDAVARKVVDEPSEEIVEQAKKERAAKRNPISRLMIFFRQVGGELRKVVTPTRKELISYTVFQFAIMIKLWSQDSTFVQLRQPCSSFGDGGTSPGRNPGDHKLKNLSKRNRKYLV